MGKQLFGPATMHEGTPSTQEAMDAHLREHHGVNHGGSLDAMIVDHWDHHMNTPANGLNHRHSDQHSPVPGVRSTADLAAQAASVRINNARYRKAFIEKHGAQALADIRREKAYDRAREE